MAHGSLLCTPAIRLFVLAVVLALAGTAHAETGDTKGREFWLTFLPNYHNMPNVPEDSLYIVISAEQPTRCGVAYYDNSGIYRSISFSISAGASHTFAALYSDLELRGHTTTEPGGGPTPHNEQPVRLGVHISADEDISVVALNQARTTADAFLVYPVDALGTDYMILSYTADRPGDRPGQGSTPSEFAVVAVEDSTQVQIYPSAPTSGKKNTTTHTITLNKGEVYLVQTVKDAASDLTGTRIEADRPCAVFAGHQRTSLLPTGAPGLGRDHLAEQLPPVSSWGREFALFPFPASDTLPQRAPDRYRILAAADSTDIYIDGLYKTTLSRGTFLDDSAAAVHITASRPILAAMYKTTSTRSPLGEARWLSDPFMLIPSSHEQWMDSYRFTCPTAWILHFPSDTLQREPAYLMHYMTVVLPTGSIPSLRLDGGFPDTTSFTAIGTSGYSYTTIRTTTGTHTVEADSPFGAYVYGYGYACSYGYTAGYRFSGTTLDVADGNTLPPAVEPPFPNPANDCTSLRLALERSGPVSVNLWDITGSHTYPAFSGTLHSGIHTLRIPTAHLAAGLYICETILPGARRYAYPIIVR